MRSITTHQFYKIIGMTAPVFRTYVQRNEVGLAFGAKDFLCGGVATDLDCIAMRLIEAMTPAFGRRLGSAMVRQFNDVWCEAVAEADRGAEAVYVVLIETGKQLIGNKKRRLHEGANMDHGTAAALAALAGSGTLRPERMTWINLTSILSGVRDEASKLGLDFSAPFLPPPDNPDFAALVKGAHDERAKFVRRIPIAPRAEART